jgi:hypothetical protein
MGEGQDNHEEFLIGGRVIALCLVQRMRVEFYGVKVSIVFLHKNSSNSESRRIGFEDEGTVVLRVLKDWFGRDGVF